MKLTAEEKQNLGEACERHRLFLLAKNDYNRFEALIGRDKAQEKLADLKETRRLDAKLCLYAKESGLLDKQTSDFIDNDVKLYIESKAGKSAICRMKLHIVWAALSLFVLLAVAISLCLSPWISNPATITADYPTLTGICIVWIGVFLLFIWNASIIDLIYNLLKARIPGVLRDYLGTTKGKLSIIAAPLLLFVAIRYLGTLSLNDADTIFYQNISLSVVAFMHIALILDCLAGLSPRKYYFCMEGFVDWIKGWFEGRFSPFWTFTPSLCNCYNDKSYNIEERYRDGELFVLTCAMHKSWCWLGNSHGELEFHPSPSLKFIAAYVLVDILHTSCIIAWMVAIMNFLPQIGIGYSLAVAAISFALLYVMLNRPVYATNRFHWFICRNLYAYTVSHLFRKLFYSAILVGGIIGLSYTH